MGLLKFLKRDSTEYAQDMYLSDEELEDLEFPEESDNLELSYDESIDTKIQEAALNQQALEKINIYVFDEKELTNYVTGQCEIIKDAAKNTDSAMDEYSRISDYFKDIEQLENAPENIKNGIALMAEEVDNLTVDRHIYKATESKLSNSAYHRMEMYEDEIPRIYHMVKQQESSFEDYKRDLRMLEGERMALRLEAKTLRKRQTTIKQIAMTTFICLMIVFSIFTIAIISMGDDENIALFFVVTILGAVLALGMFALLKSTQRQVLVTEVKLNKAVNLLNKVKIKYINALNVLEYEYQKHHVKNADELGRKYEMYMQMKEEQKSILQMTGRLNEAHENLISLLKNAGMCETNFWIGHIKALYNHMEMVEVRHELSMQRQKLRSVLEYNEGRIKEAKFNIKKVTLKHPQFTEATIKILDDYEKKTLI